MKAKLQLFFLLIYFLSTGILSSQTTLTGRVVSARDSSAISGASIYFDGTSIGVSTGDKGEFKISTTEATTSPLIISSLGYITLIISNYPSSGGALPTFYLEESNETLGEVFLETDPWTRKKKLTIFKREFLGVTPAALKCKIKNEEVLQLRYIPSTQTLVASATAPIVVVNRFLGYEVTYNLRDFKAEFSTGSSGFRFTHMVYYEGFSFFKEIRKKTSKKILKNREKVFGGSTLHFMRSLASRTLSENDFRIFKKSYEVAPYSVFKITPEADLMRVELLDDNINILYRQLDQSSIQAQDVFYIDALGNHSPPHHVITGGTMGMGRIAHLLPLNYGL